MQSRQASPLLTEDAGQRPTAVRPGRLLRCRGCWRWRAARFRGEGATGGPARRSRPMRRPGFAGPVIASVRCGRRGRRPGPVTHRPGDDSRRLRGCLLQRGVVQMRVDRGRSAPAVTKQLIDGGELRAVHDALRGEGVPAVMDAEPGSPASSRTCAGARGCRPHAPNPRSNQGQRQKKASRRGSLKALAVRGVGGREHPGSGADHLRPNGLDTGAAQLITQGPLDSQWKWSEWSCSE